MLRHSSVQDRSGESYSLLRSRGGLSSAHRDKQKSSRSLKAFGLGWQGLKDLCGGGTLETAKYSKNANTWAGLTDKRTMLLRDYVDNYILSPKDEAQLRYASGNVGTGDLCPELSLYTPIPRYMTNVLYPTTNVFRSPRCEDTCRV